MSKTALVTGGGRGIGAGIVEKLASEGWNVVFCGRKEESAFAERCRELESDYGVKAAYFSCDVSNREEREGLLKRILGAFGSLEALVNNAGVAPLVRADLLEMSEESFDRVLDINLKGPFFLTQLVGRHFAENKVAGVIVNVGSVSATVASISRGEYCISKAGVAMATKLFAVKMAEFGVPVYEIRPGVIASDMTSVVKAKYDKLIAEGLTLQPRWGEPADIGKAVAMLLRGDLAYSTGQVINVDGGMEIGRL
ncbi:MAG: 3-ketoacyl-ACP reductase [Lentisphaeria bacterium]|nr:3-ketoacyl-ACP reductase [Lentisphaeria bacterium]